MGTLFRVAAGLIGLVLMLAGVAGFFYGLFLLIRALTGGSGNWISAVVMIGGSIVVCSVATALGRFSQGRSRD